MLRQGAVQWYPNLIFHHRIANILQETAEFIGVPDTLDEALDVSLFR